LHGILSQERRNEILPAVTRSNDTGKWMKTQPEWIRTTGIMLPQEICGVEVGTSELP
jgi:hypothetical protein